MRILVLGAGALGGYFGGRLQQAGADVTFLVRAGRRTQLERDGLVIESRHGDARLEVRSVAAGDVRPEFDVVLLTCKAYDLDAAIEAIEPAVGRETAILPVLNGISHMEVLNARFGRDAVLGGVAMIGAVLAPDGRVRHLDDNREIVFGEQDAPTSPRCEALCRAFAAAPGVEVAAVPDILRQMWQKLIMLGTMASATCLMRANIGEILRGSAEGGALLRRILQDTIEIARAAGHPPGEAFVVQVRAMMSREASTATASMLRDLEAGGRIEAEHITGYLLRRAREHGLDDTLLATAYAHLKAYEQRRKAGRLPGADA
ncbi:MAG TPA: 2-dehydropantoate 2-reductase [Acetobacteraceae bacterium]|nr:2-dehydropantoate 2-reductase [Acetobacteraceae bacterium]